MTNIIDENDPQLIRAKINGETAKIPWKELQRFFASGRSLYVEASLDLVEVAFSFHQDDAKQVEQWLNNEKVLAVSTDQAKRWVDEDSMVWAVVVKPWVLIQDRE
ncbi:MAG: DUF2288 domain-containing protein [Gammaproteobacteria bacterium]|nr:DUF2288 domain-containing protein [Gammaproteobacteria bacterium]